MSHQAAECDHVWGTWSTVEITNAAGERQFILERYCYSCGRVDVEPMGTQEGP